MKIQILATVVLVGFTMSKTALADLRVFACEPEWAALAQEIGGGKVRTDSATQALQDPHYIEARPSLISRVRKADLVVCTGAQLEIGWLPMLLGKANNPAVLPGSAGFLEASSVVDKLDVPSSVDRSQGDVHSQGNPHIQVNPHNISRVAVALAQRMATLDAKNASSYQQGLEDFNRRWEAAILRWDSLAKPLRGKRVVAHHKSFVYLESWLGLNELATLEPLPGIPPSSAHLAELLQLLDTGGSGADFIIREAYQNDKASEWLSQKTGIPAIVLPTTVGGSDAATDLFTLFDDILRRLLGALK